MTAPLDFTAARLMRAIEKNAAERAPLHVVEAANVGTYGYEVSELVDIIPDLDGYRVMIGNRLHSQWVTLSNAARAASEIREKLA